MTVTQTQIDKLRRMVNEPTNTVYSDDDLESYIIEHACTDDNGEDPTYLDTSTTPPTPTANSDWIATYDLNAAAAEIWDEKAADLADLYDFAADGGRYNRSGAYEQAVKMAAKYRGKSAAKSNLVLKWPNENEDRYDVLSE
jgi:hypothetical protein